MRGVQKHAKDAHVPSNSIPSIRTLRHPSAHCCQLPVPQQAGSGPHASRCCKHTACEQRHRSAELQHMPPLQRTSKHQKDAAAVPYAAACTLSSLYLAALHVAACLSGPPGQARPGHHAAPIRGSTAVPLLLGELTVGQMLGQCCCSAADCWPPTRAAGAAYCWLACQSRQHCSKAWSTTTLSCVDAFTPCSFPHRHPASRDRRQSARTAGVCW